MCFATIPNQLEPVNSVRNYMPSMWVMNGKTQNPPKTSSQLYKEYIKKYMFLSIGVSVI